MQAQAIAQFDRAFTFHPGCDTTASCCRFLEALPETGRILIDDLAGQMAGTVLHIDHQRCPAVKLHPG